MTPAHAAIDRLERALRHDRRGCSAIDYYNQASALLRRAGLLELANEVADEFGCDVPKILEEINRAASA